MIFIKVLLPAPFSPSTAWISPGFTLSEISSLATTLGYLFVMPVSTSRGLESLVTLIASMFPIFSNQPLQRKARQRGEDAVLPGPNKQSAGQGGQPATDTSTFIRIRSKYALEAPISHRYERSLVGKAQIVAF